MISQTNLVNYSQLGYDSKPFTDFEYNLFNDYIDVSKIDIDKLFIEQNEADLIAVLNYYDYFYDISNTGITTHSKYNKCIDYLVRLDSPVGYLKRGNYEVRHLNNLEAGLTSYILGGYKKSPRGSSTCFYNAGRVYFECGKYSEAIQMLDEAIKLKNTEPAYFALKARACMTFKNFPKAINSIYLTVKTLRNEPKLPPLLLNTPVQLTDATLVPSTVTYLPVSSVTKLPPITINANSSKQCIAVQLPQICK